MFSSKFHSRVCSCLLQKIVALAKILQGLKIGVIAMWLSKKRFFFTVSSLHKSKKLHAYFGYILDVYDLQEADSNFRGLLIQDHLIIPNDVIANYKKLNIYRKLAVTLITNKYSDEFYQYLAGYSTDSDLIEIFNEKLTLSKASAMNKRLANYIGKQNDLIKNDSNCLIRINDTLLNLLINQNILTTLKSTQDQKASLLISIIVCGRNSAETIILALSSLLAQSYPNLEIIFYDDASNDDSYELAQNLLEKSSCKYQCVRGSKQKGVYSCRNQALRVAKGEIITFHDADDWAHPNKISIQAKPLLRSSFLQCSSSEWIKYSPNKKKFTSRKTFPIQHWNCSSFMFRKSVIRVIGYYDEMPFGADSEFVARVECAFSPFSHRKIRLILTIGLTLENSLTNATTTGFDEYGWSYNRQRYAEKWAKWHAHCFKNKYVPFLPIKSQITSLDQRKTQDNFCQLL